MDGPALVIELAGDRATVETEVEIQPAANTKLMGLYASGGGLYTQCEAEGFRRITFFPDRPDVLSRATGCGWRPTRRHSRCCSPTAIASLRAAADGGRHWAQWEDPFPKPCYLFALVAGDLAPNRDRFTTMSGRTVDLAIWVKRSRPAPDRATRWTA